MAKRKREHMTEAVEAAKAFDASERANYGRWLKRRRLSLGLSQADLADAADVCAKSIARWENGRVLPCHASVRALSAALGFRGAPRFAAYAARQHGDVERWISDGRSRLRMTQPALADAIGAPTHSRATSGRRVASRVSALESGSADPTPSEIAAMERLFGPIDGELESAASPAQLRVVSGPAATDAQRHPQWLAAAVEANAHACPVCALVHRHAGQGA